MRRLTLLTFLLSTIAFAQTPDKPILGFKDAAKEHALEAQFDAKLNRDDLRTWMKRLSARPHHLGTAYDHDNQEFVASLFRSWGYDTRIEEFEVLFPTPKTRILEMVAPEHYTAKLAEPPIPQDATSGQTSEQLPACNAARSWTCRSIPATRSHPASARQRKRSGSTAASPTS